MVISVNVSNFDAAVEWYGKALGFELVYRLDQYGWGEVRTPLTGITIGLGQSEELKHGGTVPTFTVKDIEAARAHLESLDTKFDGDTYEIDGMVKLATFYDPDGNAWMLAERLDTRRAPRISGARAVHVRPPSPAAGCAGLPGGAAGRDPGTAPRASRGTARARGAAPGRAVRRPARRVAARPCVMTTGVERDARADGERSRGQCRAARARRHDLVDRAG